MSPVQNNKKSEELKKKRQRLETETQNAKKKLEQQREVVTKKENELKQVDADLVSALLVENGLTVEELAQLLAQPKETMYKNKENQPKESETVESGHMENRSMDQLENLGGN